MYSSTTDGMSRGANACRSRWSSIGMRWVTARPFLLPPKGGSHGLDRKLRRRIGRGDDGLHAAANGKIANNCHTPRRAGGDQIIEDLVRHGFEEDAPVAELEHVVLQRLQLDAAVAGHVGDTDF